MAVAARFRQQFLLLFLILSLIISAVSYFAINKIVGTQSRLQQQAMAPIIALLSDELLRPYYVASTLNATEVFLPLFDKPLNDEEAISAELRRLSEHLGPSIELFIASERHGKQFFSHRASRPINAESTPWYGKFKNSNHNQQIVLGNQEEVRLFIDFKEYNAELEFLGIAGVALRLNSFMTIFDAYKQQYGYEFFFVDDRNRVLLSSDSLAQPEGITGVKITEFEWYQTLTHAPLIKGVYSNLVMFKDTEHLVLELPIKEFGWRTYVMIPFGDQADASGVSLWRLVMLVCLIVVSVGLVALFVADGYDARIRKRLSTDAMTGIYNRRYVEQRIKELQRRGTPTSLVMLDIDHFKSINDTYGHNTGDQVIAGLGSLLKDAMRGQDVAARWGGEEFMVLLPEAKFDAAKGVAERLRLKIEEQSFGVDNGQELKVTASFGVTYAVQFDSMADLVHLADKALYSAKHNGRNRVVGQLSD